MLMKYKKYSHSVGQNYKHIQITSKYRLKVFNKPFIKKQVEKAICEVCRRHKIEIKAINVQADHVHILVDCPRTLSDSKLIQLIKGGSSFILFRAVPGLRDTYPKGHLWSKGYFCANIGSDYSKVFDYIENQDLHHKN